MPRPAKSRGSPSPASPGTGAPPARRALARPALGTPDARAPGGDGAVGQIFRGPLRGPMETPRDWGDGNFEATSKAAYGWGKTPRY